MPFNLTPVSSALADEIKITLGGSTDDDGIDVELTPSQLQQVITDSVRTLNAKRPRRAWAALTGYAEATSRYVLDHPGIIGVTNVALTSGNAACDDASCVFNVMPFYPSGPYSDQVGDGMTGPLYGGNVPALTQPGPGDTLADRMIALSYMDYSKLLGGQGPGWTVRNEAGVVVLYVAAGKQGKVMYEYSYRVTPDDDPTTGVGTVTRDSDRQWLKDYAVARAKMILGRVLRKHGGINMPGGSTEPMDGDALVTEGTQELQQLEDAIDKRRRPSLPLRG